MWKVAALIGLFGSPVMAEGLVVSGCQVYKFLAADCKITNKFDFAISEFSYSMIVSSTDRAVPWIDTGEIPRVFSIGGGVEPNETIREFFSLARISIRAEDEKDIVIQITPTSVKDAGGNITTID